jgi:hypothetical protein
MVTYASLRQAFCSLAFLSRSARKPTAGLGSGPEPNGSELVQERFYFGSEAADAEYICFGPFRLDPGTERLWCGQ